MKIKLSRVFNIFNKRFIPILAFLAIIMLFGVISMLEIIIADPISAILILLSVFLVCFLIFLIPFPSSILADEERITYITLACEDGYYGQRGNVYYFPNKIYFRRIPKIANVQISEIGGIFYYQNSFEKLFKVGHIEIVGKTYLTTKKGDPFYIMNVDFANHICGVKKFETVKNQLKELYPNAEHIEQ